MISYNFYYFSIYPFLILCYIIICHICYFVKVKYPIKSQWQPQPKRQTQSLHSPKLDNINIHQNQKLKLNQISIFFSFFKNQSDASLKEMGGWRHQLQQSTPVPFLKASIQRKWDRLHLKVNYWSTSRQRMGRHSTDSPTKYGTLQGWQPHSTTSFQIFTTASTATSRRLHFYLQGPHQI